MYCTIHLPNISDPRDLNIKEQIVIYAAVLYPASVLYYLLQQVQWVMQWNTNESYYVAEPTFSKYCSLSVLLSSVKQFSPDRPWSKNHSRNALWISNFFPVQEIILILAIARFLNNWNMLPSLETDQRGKYSTAIYLNCFKNKIFHFNSVYL